MNAKTDETHNYVITETSTFTSLDPLDADQTQNLPVARMIYATPIEIDSQGNISSMVLTSYKYDAKNRTIEWTVKESLKFSDGSILTPGDVAFAVARMSYTRPKFPVIEYIEGLSEWSKKSNALETLPAGINVKGNSISIKLSKDVAHPLFRFTLEIFSVIPKKCVDLKTNKITCEKVPASGRYEITSKDESSINFSKRKELSASIPNKIKFNYIPASQVIDKIKGFDSKTVVAGNEVSYSFDKFAVLKKQGEISFMPAARFAILQLNPNVAPFESKLCRQIFSESFRVNFKKLAAEQSLMESSIFTKIVPGYLAPQELAKNIESPSSKELESCKKQMASSNIHWGYIETEKNQSFVSTLTETLKEFGINSEPIVFKNRKESMEAFLDNKLSLVGGGSGFWALDPSGDLQMLFTPNLHKTLNSITNDDKLQTLIKNVRDNPESKEAYVAVNKYLYNDAKFNIYSHVRRFYFSKNKDFMKRMQLGFSAPTPWQVFQ